MDTKQLIQVIQNLTGVYLTEEKKYLLESRLTEIMKEYNLKSYDEVAIKLLENSNSEFYHKVVDKITTHETRFFRDESVFDAFAKQIIPEWLQRNPVPYKNLKIWSIGCSYGQEPYSISILLKEHYPNIFKNTYILATDISKEAIDRAKNGIYTDFEIQRGLPEQFKNKYFKKISEKEFQINEELKTIIDFKIHNLISDIYPSGFDIIFCRNILIYFDIETKKKILNKLINTFTNKEGILILGSSENLYQLLDNYIIREFGLARYYEFSQNVTFFRKKS